MLSTRIGEFAALSTALFWTVTVLCFEVAGKRVGTLSLNLLRLTFGFLFLALFSWITRGMVLPLDASPYLWFWLTASGLVGFVLGDILLFQAFIEIGARISMLIYSAVPPLSALLGWFFLEERISGRGFLGMAITLIGIGLVVLERGEPVEGFSTREAPGKQEAGSREPAASKEKAFFKNIVYKNTATFKGTSRVRFRHPIRGVLLAFGGSLGQALGLILSKHGAPSYNAFSATQIRCMAGIVGFSLVILLSRRGNQFLAALRDPVALRIILLGSFFGPFLGVSLSLVSIQLTSTGVASTIMALVPVLVIVPSHLLFKEPIRFREVEGAAIAVGGTVLLFFH
ncbi:MAG: DMT family transporter [Spirochaetales bacterium]